MSPERVTNINVAAWKLLPTPKEIKAQLPLSSSGAGTVVSGRAAIQDILDGKDLRKVLVVGPCSVHDLKSASEYAERLKKLSEEVSDIFVVVMRVYFVKPRTTVGWKGFINDPYLDDSFRIEEGLYKAREFLLQVTNLGLSVGTEVLSSITPQYIDDLISWTAIGARTTESQTHREIASGVSAPVGFKNGTDGNIQVAINALKSAAHPHHFLGINELGQVTVLETRGNSYGHIVLRGGKEPNYDSVNVSLCEIELERNKVRPNIMIDCSHGNSKKDHERQPLVFENCINQIVEGRESIIGLMLESNLLAGNQSIPDDRSELFYGVSITDACMGWDITEKIIQRATEKLRARKGS